MISETAAGTSSKTAGELDWLLGAPAGAGRKVAADVLVSIDGYSSTGPDDDMSWAMKHILDEQSETYYEGIWRGASTAIVGRTNWEGFTSVWPGMTKDPNSSARTRDLGNWLATVEKVVFIVRSRPRSAVRPRSSW